MKRWEVRHLEYPRNKMAELLSVMGCDGWEMVAVFELNHYYDRVYVKRATRRPPLLSRLWVAAMGRRSAQAREESVS